MVLQLQTLLLLMSAIVCQSGSTFRDRRTTTWKISRRQNSGDVIYFPTINKAACQSQIKVTHFNDQTNGCRCTHVNNYAFYIKDGKPGCYDMKEICKDFGGDSCFSPAIISITVNQVDSITLSLISIVNVSSCKQIYLNETKIWSDGEWRGDEITANTLLSSDKSKIRVQITGTKPLGGKLIVLKLKCIPHVTRQSKDFSFLIKVIGTANISMPVNLTSSLPSTTTSPTPAMPTTSTKVLSIVRPPVVVKPSKSGDLQPSSIIIQPSIQQPAISTSRNSYSKVITLLPYTTDILPSITGYIRPKPSFSNTIFASTKLAVQETETNFEDAPKGDNNRLVIIIAIVSVVVVLAFVIGLLLKKRRTSQHKHPLNDQQPREQNIGNPIYAQATQADTDSKNNKKKDLEKKESQQTLREYASLEEGHTFVQDNIYNTLNEREMTSNISTPIPRDHSPTSRDHVYSYVNPEYIDADILELKNARNARSYSTGDLLDGFKNTKGRPATSGVNKPHIRKGLQPRPHFEAITTSKNKPGHSPHNPVRNVDEREMPIYFEPAKLQTTIKDEKRKDLLNGNPVVSRVRDFPTVEPVYFETEVEEDNTEFTDIVSHREKPLDQQQEAVSDPVYFETEPEYSFYETIGDVHLKPDQISSNNNNNKNKISHPTEYEQVHNEIAEMEPVYSVPVL